MHRKHGIFPNITSDLNYVWTSEEDKGKERNISVKTSGRVDVTSADLDNKKSKNKADTVQQTTQALFSDMDISGDRWEGLKALRPV